nr:MAG TPA: hypothetical protein [Caudoviricetes sp.]
MAGRTDNFMMNAYKSYHCILKKEENCDIF